MTEPPKDLVLEQLRLLRGDFERMEHKFDEMSHTVGAMAQTMISVKRDVRRLTDTVEIHAAAIDEHGKRLDVLEHRDNA
jgi:hypothetical protein